MTFKLNNKKFGLLLVVKIIHGVKKLTWQTTPLTKKEKRVKGHYIIVTTLLNVHLIDRMINEGRPKRKRRQYRFIYRVAEIETLFSIRFNYLGELC